MPVIVLLALGVVAAIGSRALAAQPDRGLSAAGCLPAARPAGRVENRGTVATLAELGVVFLLFDIGLHFSLGTCARAGARHFRLRPGAGAVLARSASGWLALACRAARRVPRCSIGAMLALSSTAVVARLIAERHQQNCPVGLTATAILIFQDVAAIFLLILARRSMGSGDGGRCRRRRSRC